MSVRGPLGLSVWESNILELVEKRAPDLLPQIEELLIKSSRNTNKIVEELHSRIKYTQETNQGI